MPTSTLSPQEIITKYVLVLDTLCEIAENYRISGRQEDAVSVLVAGLPLLNKVSLHQQAVFLTAYGKQLTASVLQSKRTIDEAFSVLLRANQIAESLQEQALLADVFCELGEMYYVRGHKTTAEENDYETSLAYFRQALALRETIHDANHMPSSLLSVGRMYQNIGQNEAAHLYIERAIVQAEQQQDKAIQAEATNHLALLNAGIDEIETAIQQAKVGLAIRETAELKAQIPISYLTIAELHAAQGKNTEALVYYQQCYTLAEEIASSTSMFALLGTGYIYLESNDRDEAIKHFEQALKRAEDIDRKDGIQEAQEALAEAEERTHS